MVKPEKEITLKDEFQWFLSDEFNTVRKNTPVSSNDDDDNTVRENTYSNWKNENEIDNNKRSTQGGISYSIEEIEAFNNPEITHEDIENDSQRQNIKLNPNIVNNIFKTYPDNNDSDVWSCRNCRERWDKYTMMIHDCKGSLNGEGMSL